MQAGHNQDQAMGSAIGATLVFINGMMDAIAHSNLSWGAVFDAAILAGVGAVVGFLITSLLKFIKKQIQTFFK